MITRKELRTRIKDHLEKHINDLNIEYMPKTWSDFRVGDIKGTVLIDYVSTQASDVSGQQQMLNSNITLYACLRDYYIEDDQLEILDRLRQIMTRSFTIEGFPFVYRGDERVSIENGIWYWRIDFSIANLIYAGE